MKFGLFYELQLPRPADQDQWNPDDERRIVQETLELFAREVMPEFKERHHLQQKWRQEQLDGVAFEVNSTI